MPTLADSHALRFGIMGGTFDPIHIGHLITAEAVLHKFKLEKVFFVPSGRPPHKEGQRVSQAEDRYLMTFLSVVANTNFEVSRIELDRQGMSYTVDTIIDFKNLLGHDAQLYFITGADALQQILSWRRVKEVLANCTFVGATRPGYGISDFLDPQNFPYPQYLPTIHTIEVPAMAISSTEIRRRVREGGSVKYLVVDAVEKYIMKNKLYRN